MRDWSGKRYWLVGASDGLGAAVAHQLSRRGVSLVLSARSEDRLKDLAEALPGRADVVTTDVTDAESLKRAADAAGEIDGVVQTSGAYWPFGATEWDAEQAETMAQVNYVGTMKLMSTILPRFTARNRGHIVLTGSLAGFRGLPGAAPYSSSKAGVMSLAESLHADLKGTGVEVQLVNPGFVRTRLTDKNDFAMPFIMEPEKAAQIFVEHMTSDSFQRSFPWQMALAFRAAQILPDSLYYRIFA